MPNFDKDNDSKATARFVLLATYGLAAVGIVSFLGMLTAMPKENYVGAGALAVGAALSFGLLLSGIVRR